MKLYNLWDELLLFLRIRKYGYRDPRIIQIIINKQLKKHKITYDFVSNLPKGMINGKEWFSYYTLTTKEHNAWKKWSLHFLRTRCSLYCGMTQKYLETQFAYLDLMWGLRILDTELQDNTE